MSTRPNHSDDLLFLRTYLSGYGLSSPPEREPRCCDDERDILAAHREALRDSAQPAVPAWRLALDAGVSFARFVASVPGIVSRAGRPAPRRQAGARAPLALASRPRTPARGSDEAARRNAA